ncbi:MAG: hypothetical protein II829_03215 [Bacteroidales bacterium]|nr:hypothetical protein [Bacteroidales bacterium]MBQ4398580.1 hypothetical protein [Bacteroidales bacterium]
MIKKLTIILLILASNMLVWGQQDWVVVSKKSPLSISIYGEVGWALSSYHALENNFDVNFSPIAGMCLGGGAGLNLEIGNGTSSSLSAQAGLLYTRSGFAVEEQKVAGHYLCLPIAFQYYPLDFLYMELRAVPSLNIGSSPDAITIHNLTMVLDNHRANDFKIGLGAGGFIKSIGMGISMRYNFGLSKFAENLPWKGNQFEMLLYYRFDFKK